MRKVTMGSDDRAGTTEAICIDSHELFQGRQVIGIWHAGQTYRLRITRQNKLILTK